MKHLLDGISNWWSPQPQPICGDVFKQIGLSYNTPETIKNICCPIEDALGLKGPALAIAALVIGGGVFTYYGGPQRLWKNFRKENVANLIMASVQIGITVNYPKIAVLIPSIKLALDKFLPEVIDKKKQQKRHDILNKINGISKMQKDAVITNYDQPENQKAIEKVIHEELISDISNYIRTYADRFSNGTEEDKQIIIGGLENFLLNNQFPSFKKSPAQQLKESTNTAANSHSKLSV